MNIHKFNFNQKGMERFFGPLEAKILDILWSHQEMSIKEVQQKLGKEKDLNFNTVMTVMNRLLTKGILTKVMENRTSMYRPIQSKEEFLNSQSKEISLKLLEDFGPLVVNHMLDAMEEVDSELLAKLELKIKSLKEGK